MDYDFSGLTVDQVAWIKDLLTTDSAQATGRLESIEGGFCCLGRACVALGIIKTVDDGRVLYDNAETFLSIEMAEKLKLHSRDGEFARAELTAEDQNAIGDWYSLTQLNDILKWSFKQIGEFILRNKTAVFNNDVDKPSKMV